MSDLYVSDRSYEQLTDELERLTLKMLNLSNANIELKLRIAELESDDHEWYLQAERIAKLEAAMKSIALYKGAEPAKDFGNCVQIARYALYPEGVKFRSKEFYELVDAALQEDK